MGSMDGWDCQGNGYSGLPWTVVRWKCHGNGFVMEDGCRRGKDNLGLPRQRVCG